jgi:hypothetical protein
MTVMFLLANYGMLINLLPYLSDLMLPDLFSIP